MSAAQEPKDPEALEAWLEESLTEEEAAEFLGGVVSRQWLQRARCTPGAGPEFVPLSPRKIVYVRRDLIAFRDVKRARSTADYRKRPQEAGDAAGSPPDGEGAGE